MEAGNGGRGSAVLDGDDSIAGQEKRRDEEEDSMNHTSRTLRTKRNIPAVGRGDFSQILFM